MRFIVTAAVVNGAIAFTNVLDGIILAATAVTGFQLFDQVRIHAVEMWAIGSGVTPVTVDCTFTGNVVGASGSARVWSDTSVSLQPAHIRAVPGPLAQAGQWQPSTANNAFTLNCPAGTVIDVDVSYRNDNSAPLATAALVAAVPGEIYYRGLDGVAIAATNFVPQAPLTR
jgi:hypothetical protein